MSNENIEIQTSSINHNQTDRVLALLLILLLSFCLPGCNDKNKFTNVVDPTDLYGTWEQVGYGNIWVFDSNGAQRFQATRETCIELPFVSNAELEMENLGTTFIDKFISSDKNTFTSQGVTDAVFGHYYTRLRDLPTQCKADQLITTARPTQQFEHLWHNFNDYYSFFTLRGVDWQQQYTDFKPMVSDDMSQEALFNIFSDMLSPIDDGHISLTFGDELEYFPEQPAQVTQELLRDYEDDGLDQFFDSFEDYEFYVRNIYDQVQTSYLNEINEAGSIVYPESAIKWGTIDGNIGYLRVNRMLAIADEPPGGEDWITKDLAAIQDVMEQVVDDFANVDGVIIDVRINGGGLDNVALVIANHFAHQRQRFATKYTDNWQGKTRTLKGYLDPAPTTLQVPVTIMTSGLTGSAAETFLIAMHSIPEVTIIGSRSEGILSNTLDKELLNDMSVSISNEIVKDFEGNAYEAIGVPVDRSIKAYDLDGFGNGKDTALEAAIEYLTTQF